MSLQSSNSDISDDSGDEIWDMEELEASLEANSDSDHKWEKAPRRSRKKNKPKKDNKGEKKKKSKKFPELVEVLEDESDSD